jgi:gluconate 2-dehydrogenase gamma chain
MKPKEVHMGSRSGDGDAVASANDRGNLAVEPLDVGTHGTDDEDNRGPASPSRRRLFHAVGAVSAAAALPARSAGAQTSASTPTYVFLNTTEARFIEAAVARLIPSDGTGPGAIEAGVPSYIDKQLAGAWGAGERFYRTGPWQQGTPSQGYQLPFTPAELFRTALRELQQTSPRFASLASDQQDAFLRSLQQGQVNLAHVPSDVFFDSLLGMTIEGYLADPAYGGNRDMAAWKMIGFPGAYADFYEYVGKNVAYHAPPTSLAQDASGHIHVRVVKKGK